MKKMNEMEEKRIKVTETDLEQVVGGVTLRELMKEAYQQVKDIIMLNELNADAPNHDTGIVRK